MTQFTNLRSLSLLFFAFLLLHPGVSAQGFKSLLGKKTETVLKRRLAAYVVIKNKRIKLTALAQGNAKNEDAVVLRTKLITDIQKDANFIEGEYNPETLLKFTLTAFDVEFRTGTKASGNQMITYILVGGNIEVSYQAFEALSNAPVDSENLSASFKAEYPPSDTRSILDRMKNPLPDIWGSKGSGAPPSKSELENYLLNSIVKQMAQRATPIDETFLVPLPKGNLDKISKIAQQQSWPKVAEAAEKMAPFKDPREDAYRLYLIGLGNEAMAYEAKTVETTREYLFKARKFYEDAKNQNPNEDEFIAPWTRMDKAVMQYDKIKHQDEEYKKFMANKAQQPRPSGPGAESGGANAAVAGSIQPVPPPPAPTEEIWDNQTVIKLMHAGMPEQTLADLIRHTPKHKFDMSSPRALVGLAEAKVPASVLQAMIDRIKGSANNNSTTPVKPPAPKPKPKRKRP